MAKKIMNPIELRLVFIKEDSIWTLDPSVQYGVRATEYPKFDLREVIPVQLTQQQEDAVIQMAASVVYPQILAAEGIS